MPELLADGAEKPRNGVRIGHVHRQGQRQRARGPRLGQAVLAATANRDLPAICRETQRGSPPDSGCSSGYDDGLGGGYIVDNTLEGVYAFAGTCGGTAGVSENSLDGFSFYPNPTSQNLSLKSVENIESVSLFNLLGQKVLEANVNATTTDVNVSGLTTGTYIMKVTINGQVGTFKVLKN